MGDTFYPFVEGQGRPEDTVRFAARIAVYDDAAAAPRVVMVQPADVRSYLEEITATTTRLATEQGGHIPFMVIREIVENLIHAYFTEPIVSILDGGDTIRFADQGPGIADKARALEYGTTSATDEMKRYIRGVGSGLPYVQQYLLDKGGSLEIDDNMGRGTVVTISLVRARTGAGETTAATAQQAAGPLAENPPTPGAGQPAAVPGGTPMPGGAWQAWPAAQAGAPQGVAWPAAYQLPQQMYAPVAQPYFAPQPYAPAAPTPAPAGWPAPPAAPDTATQDDAPAGLPQPTAAPQSPLDVSERGRQALAYLVAHESVGPTELAAAYGSSQSTWTRELKALEQLGLIAKHGGQKRQLTAAGRAMLW